MRSPTRILALLAIALYGCTATGAWPVWQNLRLPVRPDSVRFAVIGDSGTGGRRQYEVGARMAQVRKRFPFEFVIMLGDNMYGRETPRDFERKFERPYGALLHAGVLFYAALGNHDLPEQRFYRHFNMNGERYYAFTKGNVRFFALDSNYMDPAQLRWLERELQSSAATWRICFFHHPLYSSGKRHGSEEDLRLLLEPIFTKYRVDAVFAGHEHIYERIVAQKNVAYFTSGGAAKLSRSGLGTSTRRVQLREAGYDLDRHFMLVEIDGDVMTFQAISRTGRTIDAGVVRRLPRWLQLPPGKGVQAGGAAQSGASSAAGSPGRSAGLGDAAGPVLRERRERPIGLEDGL